MQQNKQEQQPITQTIAKKQQQEQEQQYNTNNNFQNPYFRFIYSIHSEETKDIQFVLDTISKQAPYDKTENKFFMAYVVSNLYKDTS